MLKKVTGLMAFVFLCMPVFQTPVMAEIYKVQQGDTLEEISDKYGISEDKIANQNKLFSTILEPGQQLEIPDAEFMRYMGSMKLSVSIPEFLAGPLTFKDILPNVPLTDEMVFMGDTNKKRIALTFDDGPEDQYTPQILKILRQKNVKATFFIVGKQIEAYPEQLQQIHNEGHVIGNHTWAHSHLPELTDEQMYKSIQKTSTEIEEQIGVKPTLFRPPFGEIKDRQSALLRKKGYSSIFWTADTNDWRGVSAEEIVDKVKQEASPGVIVLQHNYHVSGKFETVKALPQIIDELRAEGYEFVTVPTLLGR